MSVIGSCGTKRENSEIKVKDLRNLAQSYKPTITQDFSICRCRNVPEFFCLFHDNNNFFWLISRLSPSPQLLVIVEKRTPNSFHGFIHDGGNIMLMSWKTIFIPSHKTSFIYVDRKPDLLKIRHIMSVKNLGKTFNQNVFL